MASVLISLTGCAHWFPVVSQQVRPGVYLLNATGSPVISVKTLQNKIDKKVEKLRYPHEYIYQRPADYSMHRQKVYLNGRWQTSFYGSLTQHVICQFSFYFYLGAISQ